MTKRYLKWGLAAALFIVMLGAGTSRSASAATMSFTAAVFSLDARSGAVNVPQYAAFGGIPYGAGFFGMEEHEALEVNYQTNGLPYYVSNVTYTANSLTKFVPTGPDPTALGDKTQPATEPNFTGLNTSFKPVAPALTIGAGFGNQVSQAFAFTGAGPEFNQGLNGDEFTYVRIDNAAGEMKGTASGNSLFDFGGSGGPGGVAGSTITVTFTRNPGADTTLPAFLTLTANFSNVSTPGDPAAGNLALTGGNVEVVGAAVPEPGALAMLLGLGVSGSTLLLFRRRK